MEGAKTAAGEGQLEGLVAALGSLARTRQELKKARVEVDGEAAAALKEAEDSAHRVRRAERQVEVAQAQAGDVREMLSALRAKREPTPPSYMGIEEEILRERSLREAAESELSLLRGAMDEQIERELALIEKLAELNRQARMERDEARMENERLKMERELALIDELAELNRQARIERNEARMENETLKRELRAAKAELERGAQAKVETEAKAEQAHQLLAEAEKARQLLAGAEAKAKATVLSQRLSQGEVAKSLERVKQLYRVAESAKEDARNWKRHADIVSAEYFDYANDMEGSLADAQRRLLGLQEVVERTVGVGRRVLERCQPDRGEVETLSADLRFLERQSLRRRSASPSSLPRSGRESPLRERSAVTPSPSLTMAPRASKYVQMARVK